MRARRAPSKLLGDDTYAQLGDGSATEPGLIPLVVNVPASTSLVGGNNDFCTIGAAQKVMCWGDNTSGELGLGNYVDAFVPTVIPL